MAQMGKPKIDQMDQHPIVLYMSYYQLHYFWLFQMTLIYNQWLLNALN